MNIRRPDLLSTPLLDLCMRAAKKVCRYKRMPHEVDDLTNTLWLRCREDESTLVNCPDEDSIYDLLERMGSSELDKNRRRNARHTQYGEIEYKLAKPEQVTADYEAQECWEKLREQAQRSRQNLLAILNDKRDGYSQAEIADRLGMKQYQISRLLAKLK